MGILIINSNRNSKTGNAGIGFMKKSQRFDGTLY